jgi:hypothetical protein
MTLLAKEKRSTRWNAVDWQKVTGRQQIKKWTGSKSACNRPEQSSQANKGGPQAGK